MFSLAQYRNLCSSAIARKILHFQEMGFCGTIRYQTNEGLPAIFFDQFH